MDKLKKLYEAVDMLETLGLYKTESGLYISTYGDTDRKLNILNTINRELNLNLKIEKVMLE